jgi:hypothetical protein
VLFGRLQVTDADIVRAALKGCVVRGGADPRKEEALAALDRLVAERDEALRNEKIMRERYDAKYINWQGNEARVAELEKACERAMGEDGPTAFRTLRAALDGGSP